jgi:hypothetical protein
MAPKPEFASGALIEGWLRDMACVPQRVSEPTCNWAFEANFPPDGPLNVRVMNPKAIPRAVAVVARVMPSPSQAAAWPGLDEDARREFWHDLRSKLNREFTEYQIEGTMNVDCPTAFVVQAIRWDDGLTLDSFARSLSSINKAFHDGSSVFEERLGSSTPSSGGEFAFKKLPIQ